VRLKIQRAELIDADDHVRVIGHRVGDPVHQAIQVRMRFFLAS